MILTEGLRHADSNFLTLINVRSKSSFSASRMISIISIVTNNSAFIILSGKSNRCILVNMSFAVVGSFELIPIACVHQIWQHAVQHFSFSTVITKLHLHFNLVQAWSVVKLFTISKAELSTIWIITSIRYKLLSIITICNTNILSWLKHLRSCSNRSF
ncbi:Uncharacterised protein [Chlamydia trachomatis]|nr:Uncharacterised protein [Chlamydia trachomatis]